MISLVYCLFFVSLLGEDGFVFLFFGPVFCGWLERNGVQYQIAICIVAATEYQGVDVALAWQPSITVAERHINGGIFRIATDNVRVVFL